MAPGPAERRLAAIMFTDIVGYTALMAESEERGLRARENHRAVVRPLVERYGGQWIEETGDESLSCFTSALDAARCALAIQDAVESDAELRLRIGIHLGDLVFEGERVYGDGVNVASRIRPLAEPGGICVSAEVEHSIRNQPDLEAISLGERLLKNVGRPVHVFAIGAPGRVVAPGARTPDAARPRGWIRYIAAALGGTLVLVGLALWLQSRPVAEPASIRSLAVLPLENLSGDPAQEYFADGMTEAVISEFARIGALRVISRTSVMQYKGSHRSLPEIARELNVQGVVEGSVLRADDRVRITLLLVDARADRHLWAQSFERDLRDVLALQAEIAWAVARAVEAELTPGEQARLLARRSVDPKAHDAYLRGTLHLAQWTEPDAYKAIEYFERALDRDPDHAESWVGLGEAYRQLGWGLFALPPREATPKARAAAERAIALDDSLAGAHAGLGDLLAHYEWRWGEAERELRRAVELSPGDPAANNRYGVYLMVVGRHAEALRFHQRAVEANPTWLMARHDKGMALFLARDYERSAQEFLKTLEVDPTFLLSLLDLTGPYLALGREEEAFDRFSSYLRSVGRDERWLQDLARANREAGARGGFRYWLDSVAERGNEMYDIRAVVASYLGEAEEAFEWLERAYRSRSPGLAMNLRNNPLFDPLRSDPRFDELLRRVGLLEAEPWVGQHE